MLGGSNRTGTENLGWIEQYYPMKVSGVSMNTNQRQFKTIALDTSSLVLEKYIKMKERVPPT